MATKSKKRHRNSKGKTKVKHKNKSIKRTSKRKVTAISSKVMDNLSSVSKDIISLKTTKNYKMFLLHTQDNMSVKDIAAILTKKNNTGMVYNAINLYKRNPSLVDTMESKLSEAEE